MHLPGQTFRRNRSVVWPEVEEWEVAMTQPLSTDEDSPLDMPSVYISGQKCLTTTVDYNMMICFGKSMSVVAVRVVRPIRSGRSKNTVLKIPHGCLSQITPCSVRTCGRNHKRRIKPHISPLSAERHGPCYNIVIDMPTQIPVFAPIPSHRIAWQTLTSTSRTGRSYSLPWGATMAR